MQSIIDILSERPMISVRGIEQAVGLPNATIKKVANKVMNLSAKHHDKIPLMETLLMKYGFEIEKSYEDLDHIDTSTQDGRMLMSALAMMTTSVHKDKTPYEVLAMIKKSVKVVMGM